jgi:hypothetical protein
VARRRLEVEPLVWDSQFVPWFRGAWDPGEHVGVIAPTGAGKTTFVGGLLKACRRYVLAFDPKGGDSTLAGLGYERLATWPGERKLANMVADNDEAGRPSRYIVGPVVRTEGDLVKLQAVMRAALTDAFRMGGWTLYADELQILTDPRMMNLRSEVDRILVAGRDKSLSFVSSFQSPSWVTPQASRQATWCAVSYTRDVDIVNRLAEILGRPKPEIRGALLGLDKFTWLLVGRDPREPVRVTIPDYIAPQKQEQ